MVDTKDKVEPKTIRYTMGIMEHTQINLINTHKNHQHGLKNRDPVIIIHKDDFSKIVDDIPDKALQDKFRELYKIVKEW
ncbi:hypothetical protein [Methanobacterium petrolearium]|uniref:hypothetical protein n=1 Tax=Methanobacterium petrolearium TaxID=710190 RepID=UPI001AE28414|nr:hypothetical protein [Methanobacterium petrolearium]MBP1946295.1 hypothetical protein [Methanobacterium petrolearium]BDZ71391.1 hypothetical protein GCM10025861_19080 [Methanobacterium petrolearium]